LHYANDTNSPVWPNVPKCSTLHSRNVVVHCRTEGGSLLEIRLLGPPEVTLDGVAIEVDTRKAIALLAYLAIERSATRDTLATLFWADSSAERARATLRRTLSSLRSGIGPGIVEADRHHIELSDVETDLDQFEHALNETAGHGHDPGDVCSACVIALTEATDLYRGNFLEGFSVRDAPEFEDWERVVTENLRLQAGQAFHRLGMARAAAGDYPGAIAAVTRWVDLDTLHEPAHRLLMLLNAWAGDRPGSVEAYRAFVAILDRELGVPPLEETTELYEAILDEDLPPAPGIRRPITAEVGVTSPVQSVMLDRLAELTALEKALEQATTAGQIASVTGPSWMGKTRLIEEFLGRVSGTKTHVLSSRAFRMEQSLPYGVATQLLRDLVPLVRRNAEHIPQWAIDVASNLDPQLGRADQRARETGNELRLFEAINTMVQGIATKTPLVAVVDDVQWMDPASASLVAYLARRISDLPQVLLVVAARSGEPLTTQVRELLDLAGTPISLGPLTPESIQDLVDNGTEAARIIKLTGGIPLLVLEELDGEGSANPGVAQYMEERLESIGDLSRQVVAAASVLTGVCDAPLLRETSGRSEDEVVEAVEELVRAGVIREELEGFGLSFTLDRLETLVYEETSLIRRRLLHRRAAAALATRPRARTEARLAAVIAAQHHGAGDPEAAEWYQLAGDLARNVYANSEAERLYERAIALGADDVGRIRLSLGDLAIRRGDYVAASTELTAAAARSKGETLAEVEHRLGEVQRLLGRFEMAQEHYARSADLNPNSSALFADWALLYRRQNRFHEASTAAYRALDTADENDSQERSRALNILTLVEQDPVDAMTHVDRALDLAGDNEVLRMAALNSKANLLADIGNTEGATPMVEQAIAIATKTGHRHFEASLRNHLADLHHQSGRVEEAQKALTEAVSLFADIDAGAWQPEVWLLRDF